MFKKYMVLSEVMGGVDCRMCDTYMEARAHKYAAECGVGARCSQIYEWVRDDEGIESYVFLEE